ncbi:MAG: hypothetical protein ACRDZY_00205 [Acidimicrobiales bacterium]
METLTDDERRLIELVQAKAALTAENMTTLSPDSAATWRYSSVHALLLAHGRLFTPQVTPPAELGTPRECFHNASDRADTDDSAVYVEGLAVRAGVLGIDVEHAWCAVGSVAVDPTWGDGQVYLGVPLRDAFRQRRQQKTEYWTMLWSPDVLELLRDGLPEDALADVGRPLPS